MSDGTVRGTFDLNADPALNKLRSIRTEGGRADAMMRQLGGTMDRIGGPESTKRLNTYEGRLRKVGDQAESTAGKVGAAWDVQRRAIDDQSTRIETRVDRVEKRVERYGRQRSTATVELNGFEKVNAQLLVLERRLNSLSRQRVTPNVGISGGFSNAVGGGGGGTTAAGGGAGGLGLGAKLAIGGAALLPGVQALGVSATGLLGSAAGATLGAGVGYGGAISTLGTGAGLTALVAKPAIKELQALQKEQTKYTEAVRKYGEASKQAAVARRELAHAEAMSPGAGTASRQLSLARSAWMSATAPGRRSIYGAIGNAAVAARGLTPVVGNAANLDAGATSKAATNYAGFLSGSQTQRTVIALSQEFAHDMPTIERSLENVTSTVEHLAVAARPFFREGTEWVQSWTHGLAANTSNEARVQTTMRGLVAETKDWGHLAGATYRTLRDIFNMGRPSGDSMVVGLTQTLDRWDAWIQRNPQKVSSFFKEAQTTTEKIAEALVSITHLLSQAATALEPIFNRGMSLVSLVSRLGPGATTGVSAALYGGYAGIRSARGGAGPSAGAVVATGVLGRPLRSGSNAPIASRIAGGTVAGGGTARYLMPAGGATGTPRSAMGQLPLFLSTSKGVVPNTARTAAAGAATPEEFASRYGHLEGARYAAPVSTVERAGGVRSAAGSAIGGAAKTIGTTLAIMGALEALGKGGSPREIAQNFGSSVSFGLIPSVNNTGSRGSARATTFLGGIPQTMSPQQQQAVIGRKLSRELGTSFTDTSGLNFGPTGFLGTKTAERVNYAGRQLNPSAPGFLSQVGSQLKVLEGTPGDHTKNQVQEIKALRVAYQEASASATAYKKSREEALNQKSEAHGLKLGAQLGTAFGIETRGGKSSTSAFGDVTRGALASMKSMRAAGAKVLGENTLAWAHQLERSNPQLEGPVDELTASIKKRFHDLGQNVQIVNGHILTGSREQWEAISTAMSEPVEKARQRMSKSFTAIQQEAVGALVAMGFNKKGAEAVVSGQEKGGPSAGQITSNVLSSAGSVIAGATGKKHARGGMIGGHGMTDTVPVPGGKAAPGEGWIANRHTLADMSRATVQMYGLTAQQMISGEHRLHSMNFARGGPLSGVRSGVASVAGAILSQFPGLSVTSTTGGTHATNSLHYLGEAVDIAGPSSTMLSAASWTGSTYGRMLAEGIHNPNLSIKSGHTVPSSFWGEPTWAEHANHIHVGVIGGGGARGAAAGAAATGAGSRAIRLRKRTSGMGGVPGMLADAGISKYTKALQSRVNAHLHSTGTGNFAGVTGKGGAPGANERLGKEMMLAAGWGASEWPALKALWTQESGWDANSVNSSSGAYGIPQALGHGHPFNLGDARGQIAWGLNYIKGRYGSPGAAEAHERSNNWYQRGGKMTWAGWHAGGGEYETRGPTIFGAGEGGKRERVSITPLRHGAGSGPNGHNITVKIAHVSMADGADVDKVAREVAAKILDELDAVGDGPSDRELIGR